MKKMILHAVMILSLGAVVRAADSGTTLTGNEDSEVKKKLESFDKGEIKLEDVTDTEPGVADPVWIQRLIGYYLAHTNEITTRMKLPFSRCFGVTDNYSEAAKLAQEYVQVYSNDWHGWRIVGNANFFLNHFDVAVNAYTNAVRLGDDGSCAMLAFSAMKTNRDDVVRGMVPHLLVLKNSKPTKDVDPLEISTVLIMYSLRADQKDIFVKALAGVDVKDILAHEDVTLFVKKGCEKFAAKETESLCKKLTESSSNH
jgi:hypothetical protein